jgi:hypothetical protein
VTALNTSPAARSSAVSVRRSSSSQLRSRAFTDRPPPSKRWLACLALRAWAPDRRFCARADVEYSGFLVFFSGPDQVGSRCLCSRARRVRPVCSPGVIGDLVGLHQGRREMHRVGTLHRRPGCPRPLRGGFCRAATVLAVHGRRGCGEGTPPLNLSPGDLRTKALQPDGHPSSTHHESRFGKALWRLRCWPSK